MNRLKKILIILIATSILLSLTTKKVLAIDPENLFEKKEYSEDFKSWLELSDEEKKKVIQPRMYDVIPSNNIKNNLFYKTKLLGTSINPRYSLKEVIPNNLKIKNQRNTQSCWAFAAISSLETNLALANVKKNINTSKIYDYSERHMEYANSKFFANNKENKTGYNRNVGSGGQWFMAESYLTNGLGAINESEMPFEDNEDLIDITAIQNKIVSSQVYDTIDFADYRNQSDEKKFEIMNEIKQHITNYGSVFASIHGNSISAAGFNCYNNDTGAKFCNNPLLHRADHAVSIIGWDDNYSIDNFSEEIKPTSKGAWIIRNSWGERWESSVNELKEEIFTTYKQQCIERGWNSSTEIPNEFIEQAGYTIENDIAYIKIGDNGIMYISYEDCNISKTMYGIVKAADSIDYDKIYQYDEYYPAYDIPLNSSTTIICNIFEKKTTETEYLTQISLYAPETYKCKVYVNPNSKSKAKDDMQLVKLQAGNDEIIDTGYHTLEFENPVEIKGNEFAVAVAIEGKRTSSIDIKLEAKVDEIDTFDSVQVENGKCFVASTNDFDMCQWYDLGNLSNVADYLPNGDSTIKAFTVSELNDGSLRDIEIVTPPNKINYFEGNNFDKTGMIIKANYNRKNNPSVILDEKSYNITNGNNLKVGQTNVTITYKNKSVNQPITVMPNQLTELKVTKEPNKTRYIVGQNFDKTGMVITGKYQDETTKEILDYTIENGTNLSKNQKSVTIKYGGKNIEQPITVEEKTVLDIKINKKPTKIQYIQNKENLDLSGGTIIVSYNDGSNEEISLSSELIKISGFDNKNVGKNTITIQYANKMISLDIEIIAEVMPVNSNFDEAELKIESLKYYTYVDLEKQEYAIMDVVVDKMLKNSINDSYEYYYCLSSNENESKIENWVKVAKFNSTYNQIQFEINTKEISNYDEIVEADNLYIYIKEVAIKGDKQSVKVSNSMEIDSEVFTEIYVDDIKMTEYDPDEEEEESAITDDTKGDDSKSNNIVIISNNDNSLDKTKATSILPKTGAKNVIFILIVGVVCIILLIRYKNLNKYVK